MSKTIVVYYSFEGSTKSVAELLAQHLNADSLEIKPVKELKSKGFSKFILGGFQVMIGKKPKLKPLNKNLDDYDIVLVGSPIWAGTYTPPIKSLLEGNYIEGKKVAYFYTHQGGHNKAVAKAKPVIEEKNIFIGAKDFMNPKKDVEASSRDAKSWTDKIISNI